MPGLGLGHFAGGAPAEQRIADGQVLPLQTVGPPEIIHLGVTAGQALVCLHEGFLGAGLAGHPGGFAVVVNGLGVLPLGEVRTGDAVVVVGDARLVAQFLLALQGPEIAGERLAEFTAAEMDVAGVAQGRRHAARILEFAV